MWLRRFNIGRVWGIRGLGVGRRLLINSMNSFEQLQAWQKGMQLVKSIYELTKLFPAEEKFALTNQIRRASTSVLANVAEGFSRRTPADKIHKYTIARGECSEVLAFLLIAKSLGFIDNSKAVKPIALAEESGKLLSGLIREHLRNKDMPYAQRPTPLIMRSPSPSPSPTVK